VGGVVLIIYPQLFVQELPPPPPPPPPPAQFPPARRPFNKDEVEVVNLGRMTVQCTFCSDSIKETRDEDGNELMYPTEYLNSINVSGLPLAKLALKEGCPVMILRNLNPQEGVCNGTRGIVTRMGNRVIEVRIIGGSFAGRHIFIPRLKIEPTNAPIPFQLCRLQHPLRLAFVMTINKSQGQSLNHVGIDYRSPIFTHGQFYVAVSRSTSVHRIKAIWPPNSPPTTKNIVYPEVLLD
jgi:hypothetical protein